MVGERPTTIYIEQIKKGKRIASSQITAHVFEAPQNGMSRTIWFSDQNFRIFHDPIQFLCTESFAINLIY